MVAAVAATAGAADKNAKNAWAGATATEPWTIHPVELRDDYGTLVTGTERDKMGEFQDTWATTYAYWAEFSGYHRWIMVYFESNTGVRWLRGYARFAAKLESGNEVAIWGWNGNQWGDFLAVNDDGGDPDIVEDINIDDCLIWDSEAEQTSLILLMAGVNGSSLNEMWCDDCDINVYVVP